jgi:hypothetical protein
LDFDLLTDLTPISELAYEPLLICIKNTARPSLTYVTPPSGIRQEAQISLPRRAN